MGRLSQLLAEEFGQLGFAQRAHFGGRELPVVRRWVLERGTDLSAFPHHQGPLLGQSLTAPNGVDKVLEPVIARERTDYR